MSVNKKLVYDASSVTELEGLDPIRARPTAFIGSLDHQGQLVMCREITDNAEDELNNVNWTGILNIYLFKDNRRNTYQLLITDNGRGFPISKFESMLTRLWVSGKHRQDAYETSGGLFGLGAKVQAALSSKSKAITLRDDTVAILDMRDGNVLNHQIQKTKLYKGESGTCIMYEPSPKWKSSTTGVTYEMQEIPYFKDAGFMDIVTLLKMKDIFNERMRFTFKIFNTPIPKHIWEPGRDLDEYLTEVASISERTDCELVYDSRMVEDKSQYLLEYLGVEGNVLWDMGPHAFEKVKKHKDDKLTFSGRVLVIKGVKRSNSLVVVNSIPMKSEANSPLSVTSKLFHSHLAEYIKDPELKKFYLSNYSPPLQYALNVRYSGAQFEGTTKNTFRDKLFEQEFAKEVIQVLNGYGEPGWLNLADAILPDLEQKYALFYNKPMEQKSKKNLLLELNNPGQYTDCHTSDRSKAELFIVEGTSASHLKKILDSGYQALATTRGKPLNAMSTTLDRRVAFQRLSKDSIVGDLIRITNITPGTDLISNGCNFGKIIVTTDADPDGAHIGAIHIGNFHMLNENLISSGILYLATPPLFKINLPRGKKLLLQNKRDLDMARITNIYHHVLKLEIQDELSGTIMSLENETYSDFCALILHLGEIFTNVSRQLNIPILILERLVFGVEYLIPQLNIKELIRVFETQDDTYTKLTYQPNLNMLIISVNEKDIPLSLNSLGAAIQTQILPHLIRFNYRKWVPLVSTKLCSNFNRKPVSLMQIFHMLNELNSDKLMRIDRLKGLGEVDPKDLKTTIGDPNTRVLHRITSLGDVQRIYDLLGSNATERKKMMQATGFLSNSMA